MLSNVVRRARAHSHQLTLGRYLSVLAAATALVAGALVAAPSEAALIGTYSLRFDGFVKQGANTGEEGHFNANIPYISPAFPQHTLPANVNPPAPLLASRNLIVTETEAAEHIIISITNNTNDQNLGNLFANPLDPAVPIQWEGIFAWTNVDPLEVINVHTIGVEHNSALPFPAPTSATITGKGSVADPLKVSLLISPSLLHPTPSGQINGQFKIHLEYDRELVPEPASIALGMLGVLGIAGIVARRR